MDGVMAAQHYSISLNRALEMAKIINLSYAFSLSKKNFTCTDVHKYILAVKKVNDIDQTKVFLDNLPI